ncbi:MAG TPA: hypothetical protein VKG89_04405 [Solirubrobacterales bacterium]|nr:hypothetical protein [Solirubrobacterales bacterium]
MSFRWWDRWGPLAGIVSVALMVISFVVAGSSPDTQDDDAKIVSYYTQNSNQVKNLVALLIFAIGVLFMIAFFAALRERLVAAEGGFGRLGALAFGAGVASAVFWIVAVVLFVAPALAANDTTLFHLDPNTYRLEQDAGYAFWVAAVMTGALVVWPTSAIAFRAPILPRWFAWVGVFVGIINLFALFFFPAFVYWAWIVIASGLLTWRAGPVPAPAAGVSTAR